MVTAQFSAEAGTGATGVCIGTPKYLGRLRRETLIPLLPNRKAEKSTDTLDESVNTRS
nr:MAG TPA: hypothetical protein [Caudoviricetes sp.]